MVTRENLDKVVDKFLEVAPRELPGSDIWRRGEPRGVYEGVVMVYRRGGDHARQAHEHDWGHVRIVLMEPDGEGDLGRRAGDMDRAMGIEEVRDCAITVDVGVH